MSRGSTAGITLVAVLFVAAAYEKSRSRQQETPVEINIVLRPGDTIECKLGAEDQTYKDQTYSAAAFINAPEPEQRKVIQGLIDHRCIIKPSSSNDIAPK